MAVTSLSSLRLVRRVWACMAVFLCAHVLAQEYPERPIRVIVPMQAGSAGDVAMRIVALRMAPGLGSPMVLDNVLGAAGMIGSERIARAAPDGYTIGAMGDSMLTLVPHLRPQVHYDSLSDFTPVSMVASITSVLVVHPSVPATSVRQLLAYAQARSMALDFASAGVGSPQHIPMEFFRNATGIALRHIPVSGASQAVMEVVSGRVPVMFTALSIALPFIQDGRLRALGVAGSQRSALLPLVPTVAEAGVPGFVFTPWVGVYAPRGTPRPVVDRLNREITAALNDLSVRQNLLAIGLEPEPSTPEALAKRTAEDFIRMRDLLSAIGIKSE